MTESLKLFIRILVYKSMPFHTITIGTTRDQDLMINKEIEFDIKFKVKNIRNISIF
jgi:hypothetical protein